MRYKGEEAALMGGGGKEVSKYRTAFLTNKNDRSDETGLV